MPRALSLPCTLLLALLVSLLAVPRTAFAGDEASADELKARIHTLRTLSPEDRAALKQALARFKKLPKEKRDRLRAKARKLGEDRLRALGGRDVERLRERHGRVRSEVGDIKLYAGFDDPVVAALPAIERRYLEHRATRGFHHFIKNRLLSYDGQPFDPEEMRKKSPEVRRRWVHERIEQAMLALMTQEERDRYHAAAEKDRRRALKVAVSEYRTRQTMAFARTFREKDVTMFLGMAPKERSRVANDHARRMRFYEMARRLERELRVEPEVLALLRQLRRDEWRIVRDALQALRKRGESITTQRIEIQKLIRARHANSALDPTPRLARRRGRKNGDTPKERKRRRQDAGPR